MINPHLLKPTSKRWNDQRFAGGKVYYAVFSPTGQRSRRIFKRASEAEAHASKIHARWCRLYDAMLVDMIVPGEMPSAEPA